MPPRRFRFAGLFGLALVILAAVLLHMDGQRPPAPEANANASEAPTLIADKTVTTNTPQTPPPAEPAPVAQEQAAPAPVPVRAPSTPSVPAPPAVAPTDDDPTPPPLPPQAPRIFPAQLAEARAKAQARSPQWIAFRSRLIANLPNVLSSSYQGSMATWISDYALGAVCESDPVTAQNFADKSIGLMISLTRDYQFGGELSRSFLARADGKQTSFPIAVANAITRSIGVYFYKPMIIKLTKGEANGRDELDSPFYSILKVSDSPDGNADYAPGSEWRVPTDDLPRYIDWSAASAHQPKSGAVYYATGVAIIAENRKAQGWMFNQGAIHFRTPPPAGAAIFYDCIFGAHAADGSSLAYQQTGRGYGGVNNAMLDTGYSIRYMGKHMAMGLDWLWNNPSLTPERKSAFMELMIRWADYYRDQGYQRECPGSNYGSGGLVGRTLTGIALYGRHPQGARILAETKAYRRDTTLPFLEKDSNSADPEHCATIKGGYWAEGWNYGTLGCENLLYCGLALEGAGAIRSAAPERAWAADAIKQMLSGSPDAGSAGYPKQLIDTGDAYIYPAQFPAPPLFSVLGAFASDSATRAYADFLLARRPTNPRAGDVFAGDYRDLLFHDPAGTGRFWNDLPLQWRAAGTELICMRSAWDPQCVWAATQLGNLLNAGHQAVAAGLIEIRRGVDDLLIYGPGYAADAVNFPDKTSAANTLVVDDGGAGEQNYRFQQGVWAGTPGNHVIAYETDAGYVYAAADLHAAYSYNTRPGQGGSVREWVRSLVYVRPGFFFVHDRCTTTRPEFTKVIRWHAQHKKMSVNSGVVTVGVGQSRAYIYCYAPTLLKATLGTHKTDGVLMDEFTVQIADAAARARYVNLIEVTPATQKTMSPSAYIESSGKQLEGAIIGDRNLVLFAHTPPFAAPDSYTFTAAAGANVEQMIVGLPAGAVFSIKSGDAVTSVTVSPQGVVHFAASATGIPQTVAISLVK